MPHRLALVVAVLAVTGLTLQLLIFMRTDVYFIVQDLTGSRNLYGDSAAYTRHLARRAVSVFRGGAAASPLADLADRERRIVKGYTVLLVAGTAICLSYAAIVLVPFVIGLIHGAVTAIASAEPGAVLDGLVVLAVQAVVPHHLVAGLVGPPRPPCSRPAPHPRRGSRGGFAMSLPRTMNAHGWSSSSKASSARFQT